MAAGKQRVTLSPKGGTVTSWNVDGKEVLFPPKELLIEGVRKPRGGMHACFPNYGREQPNFKLPPHGPLRNIEGYSEGGGNRVTFGGRDILGGAAYCDLSVDVTTGPNKFTYELTAMLSQSARTPFPTNAGLHPYFATPQGSATVFINQKRYDVNKLLTEAQILPMAKLIRVNLPGIGLVNITPGEAFFKGRKSRIVLWRDSDQYLCVEPVLGTSADFGPGKAEQLLPGRKFELSCAFELI